MKPERTETLVIPRRIWSYAMFNCNEATQTALWQRMWLSGRERGCFIASLVCIAAGFVIGPLAAQLLGPEKWFSPWVTIGILLLCFFRSVVLHQHSLRYRRLRRAVESADPDRWREIDEAVADVVKSVQEDDPRVKVSVTVPS